MDRFRFCAVFGLLAIGLALTAAAGCNMVATAMYVISGQNVAADYSGLKGKRVAVVCRPVISLQYKNTTVSRDLAKQIGQLLTKNVDGIKVKDQREIDQWTDEHEWEEYVEIGKAVDVDMVLGIDLEEFELYQGQTLYQGKANLTIAVYDVSKGKDPVYEKHLPQTHYPPNTSIPAGDLPEAQFRRKFVGVLAEQIARYFYDHDSTVDFASDSTALY